MSYELIITEKPSQAKKIAESLADGKAILNKDGQVSYWILSHNKKDIVVACAVGHIYTVAEKEKSFNYPSFDIEWVQTAKVDKNASHTKKYADVIKKLAKNASEFTVACDFDIEGEVIGLNAIRYACNQKDANRMKFSTLTKEDLIKSYENKQKTLEWGQAKAGETRHFLDWMYGINISRAMTNAIQKSGTFKSLSSGRVQGPALKLIVDKEKEIRQFIPTPFWQISLNGTIKTDKIEAMHKDDKIFDEQKAKTIFEKVNKKDGQISDVNKKQSKQSVPFPFDLTTLQTESYRSLKISPKDTLAIAQNLYSNGWISYPRTSSQEIPKEIDYRKILNDIKRNSVYAELVDKLLAKKDLKPNNGPKKDPAHPAIHPTGIMPDIVKLNPRELKVYDLIVRRFMATFSEPATRETITLTIDIEKEPFIAKGTRTVFPGWHEFYGSHVKLEEQTMPNVNNGDNVINNKTELLSKETQPPKRFTPASLIKELEKRNLGTKSTRAAIIDTLVTRNFVDGKSLQATEMGIRITDILEKHIPDIVNEDLTRYFEEEMEKIRENKGEEENTLEKARDELTKILTKFKSEEKDIGLEFKQALVDTRDEENSLGHCPKCEKGTLMITYSKKNRQRFIACNEYPECNNTYSIPQKGKITRNEEKETEEMKKDHQIFLKIVNGRNTVESAVGGSTQEKPKVEEAGKNCPNCQSKLLVRKSFYGQFLGCSNYPKCNYMETMDGKVIEPKNKTKKTTKKTVKKTTKKTSSTTKKSPSTTKTKRATKKTVKK